MRGIRIGKESKERVYLLQYANDTALFVDGSEKSLKYALSVLKIFCLKAKYFENQSNMDRIKSTILGQT